MLLITFEKGTKMKKILSTMAVSMVCFTAGAQTANFEGFSGALNLNTVSINSNLTVGNDDASINGIGQQSWNASAQVAYGFVTSPNTVVSIGGTYALNKSKAGTIPVYGDLNLSIKGAYSLYVEPGFLLTDKTLAYGKLAYEAGKGTLSAGEESRSKNLSGTGYGAGIRTMLDAKSFLQIEFMQVDYKNVNGEMGSLKPKATIGTIGYGMKF